MNSATMRSPLSVVMRRPSTYTGALGSSNVPGSEMPMLECLDSPGPLTTQPITATFMVSTPGWVGLPDGHLLAQVGLDLVGHLLEEGAGGAAAAGAGGHLRREAADAQRLQNLLGDDDLFGAVAIGQRRQRGANGVADAFLQQQRQRGGGGHDSLRCPCRPRSGPGAAA